MCTNSVVSGRDVTQEAYGQDWEQALYPILGGALVVDVVACLINIACISIWLCGRRYIMRAAIDGDGVTEEEQKKLLDGLTSNINQVLY